MMVDRNEKEKMLPGVVLSFLINVENNALMRDQKLLEILITLVLLPLHDFRRCCFVYLISACSKQAPKKSPKPKSKTRYVNIWPVL